jgi:hypothetical protein
LVVQALVDALMEDAQISEHLTREKILDALEPLKYTGQWAARLEAPRSA